jgi:hypothetical protein
MSDATHPAPGDPFAVLAERYGRDQVAARVQRQVEQAADFFSSHGAVSWHLENLPGLHRALGLSLRAAGLMGRGMRNAVDCRLERVEACVRNLPRAFDGLRVLQVADPHFDGLPDRGERLAALVASARCDLCVVTGDFRYHGAGGYADMLTTARAVLGEVRADMGVWGVLGNHDFIEMAMDLEAAGVRMLVNESEVLRTNGQALRLAGVDDPHFYGAADLDRALAGTGPDECVLLLCHSPELYAQAAARGVGYYLCGHTHGGQIRLPGGFAPVTNAACPRAYASGAWSHRNMPGYTSRGAGCSSLPVRFNCPPEITLHTLRRA